MYCTNQTSAHSPKLSLLSLLTYLLPFCFRVRRLACAAWVMRSFSALERFAMASCVARASCRSFFNSAPCSADGTSPFLTPIWISPDEAHFTNSGVSSAGTYFFVITENGCKTIASSGLQSCGSDRPSCWNCRC